MFLKAKPIWASGLRREMNTLIALRATYKATEAAELHIAVAYFYRAFVDGKFIGFGPARAAKGYFRKDILPLVADGAEHEVVIEAEGLCCESLSTDKAPAFCMAEIIADGACVAFTGDGKTELFTPAYHVQRVDRYSVQRHFTEVRDYRKGASPVDPACRADMAVVYQDIEILDRGVPYPTYATFEGVDAVRGKLEFDAETAANIKQKRSQELSEKSIRWGTFAPNEIPYRPYNWLFGHRQIPTEVGCKLPARLEAGEYVLVDLHQMETGFLCASVEALEEADVVVAFSEYYEGDQFAIKNNTVNVFEYLFSKGQKIDLQSFEPYCFRFVLITVKSGAINLSRVGGISYEHPMEDALQYDCGSDLRNLIYRASVRTLAHNSVDIYMDCPSRERAGWLCDSYFTGRVEKVLFGNSLVERNFLENFRLYKNGGELPAGALPMCYPGGFINNNDFIPQWDMWYVLEVEEYLFDREPNVDREIFRASVMGVLDFLSRYENSDGLLEKLPSWNFVEWSRANKWTKDVNYPTNFLYARTLRAAYNLYGDEALLEKSRRVAEEAKRQSFNGELFTDHALRDEDGTLKNAGDISEICQYYAILFADIDINAPEYASMMHMVRNVFLPSRVATPEFDVEPINAFIGVYLRMDTLLKIGAYEQALAECEDFFGGMAQKTLTLWENRALTGSCNHGFASYAALVMMQCIEHLKK